MQATPQRYLPSGVDHQDDSASISNVPPAISILLPTFNGARFLDQQLRSVLSQTCRDFELLIYDDGSNDDTWAIVRSQADNDTRISAWRGAENVGQGEALRFLLENAAASLVSFCDQDDIWHLDKLQLLLQGIGTADLAYGTSDLIDENGFDIGANIFFFAGRAIEGADPLRFLVGNTVSDHAMLVRREIVTMAHFCQPMPFDWLIATSAAASNGLVYVKDARTRHRLHDKNQMNTFGNQKPKRRATNREAQLRNLLCVVDAVADSPTAKPAVKASFARLRLITQHLLNSHRLNVRDANIVAEIEALRPISRHDGDFHKLSRLYRRLGRGLLHPVTWRKALRQAF